MWSMDFSLQAINMSISMLVIFQCLFCPGNADGVLGCGGFIRSSVDISYSRVYVKLYTKQGGLKYQTDCAPNNGYYFVPVYDRGDYIIRIDPPNGWSFKPTEIPLAIDGETDLCSQGKDINFNFLGFGITGQVVSLGSSDGPSGVVVTLSSKSSPESSQVITATGGTFTFSPVPAGDYEVSASHPVWQFAVKKTSVSVKGDNGDVGRQLIVAGYDVTGKVLSGNRPVGGVTFVLHGRTTEVAPVAGCDVTSAPGYRPRADLPPALCHVTSDKQGRFVFPVVPSGKYTAVPHYAGDKTQFDVRPSELELVVAEDSVAISEPFQVTGFTITGRVVTSAGGPDDEAVGLAGVLVRLDGTQVAVTDGRGFFLVEGVKSGQYRLSAEAESVQFESRSVEVSPSAPRLTDLAAASFRVCGQVELTSLPEGVSPGPRSLEFKLAGSESAYRAVTDIAGSFCIFLRPGDYRVRVPVTEEERKLGLSFGSAQQELRVRDSAVNGVRFSPFRAHVSGRLTCLEPCPGLSVSLTSDGQPSKQARADSGGKFDFDNVLPGQYQLSVNKEDWCWESSSVPVTVTTTDVTDIQLTHTGYQLTVVSSHPTRLLYQRVGDSSGAAETAARPADPAWGRAEAGRGLSRLCVPAAGVYRLTTEGCHTFSEPELRADTARPEPLSLRAVQHEVSGLIRSQQPTDDIRVKVSVNSAVRELETEGRPDRREHRFRLQARPGQVLTFQPQSGTHLFSPTYHQITAEDDCMLEAVSFVSRLGTFIEGRISPALAGAKVTVTAAEMEPVTAVTDVHGTYQVGPLHPDREYEVSAEKLGYVITRSSARRGDFEARKLAELRVRVVDGQGQALSGVLVSASGGRDFRQNSLTDEDGGQSFLSLAPGQYFIRPMMKEYEFSPASKIAEVAEGATVDVSISGRRVAFSLLGRVTSLTGEPEAGVVVEAVADPSCDGHQEEGTSEPGGALRIRGLRPKCEYTLRLKTATEANSPFSRCIPDARKVKVGEGDIVDVQLMVLRRIGETDVTVRVLATVEHLATLRLLVTPAGQETPVFSQRLGAAPFLVLPSPLPLDGRQYTVRLESSLSTASHAYSLPEAVFTADAAGRHVELVFSAARRPVEQELGAGPVLGLPLTVLLLLAALNHSRLLELARQARTRLTRPASPGSGRRGSAPGDGVIVRPVNVKTKSRKV